MHYGGMPGIADVGLVQDRTMTLLDGIYSTVIVRDILERERRRGQRQITDPLRMVRDNYQKVVLAMRTDSTASVEGIRIQKVIDFFLKF